MSEAVIRRFGTADLQEVEPLLDEAIGRGFWNPATDLNDIALVAVEDDVIVGVASASVTPSGEGEPEGHVRLVAVDRASRRLGVATRLLSEIAALCVSHGATTLVAYAWVHGNSGVAPLSGVLERVGFVFDRRIEHFYGGAVGQACPACSQSPCVCAADVYRLDTTGVRG